MNAAPRPELVELGISDSPDAWTALGFAVDGETVDLGGVRIRLGSDGEGIVSWVLRGIPARDRVDGLPTTVVEAGSPVSNGEHPNGAIGLDHLVVTTADFDRTVATLEAVGMPLRRIRTAWQGAQSFRQGFRRLGPAILEVVELNGPPPDDPASFWGLFVIASDIDALAEQLGPDRCGEPRDAVQPGRRIATLRRAAGLSMPVAFMTPEPADAD